MVSHSPELRCKHNKRHHRAMVLRQHRGPALRRRTAMQCGLYTQGGNVSALGALGKVATVTVPPSTAWGHVSVWNFLM